MKSFGVFTFYILCLLQPLTSSAAIKDTIPANIKNYTKDQFLKEFAKDETSEKLIHYYFYRSKKAKQSIFIFSGLTLLTGAFIGLLANESRTPTKYDDYSFLALIGAGGIATMFLSVTAESASNRNKYSPKNLYKQLISYKSGKPLSKKLIRQLKFFKNS